MLLPEMFSSVIAEYMNELRTCEKHYNSTVRFAIESSLPRSRRCKREHLPWPKGSTRTCMHGSCFYLVVCVLSNTKCFMHPSQYMQRVSQSRDSCGWYPLTTDTSLSSKTCYIRTQLDWLNSRCAYRWLVPTSCRVKKKLFSIYGHDYSAIYHLLNDRVQAPANKRSGIFQFNTSQPPYLPCGIRCAWPDRQSFRYDWKLRFQLVVVFASGHEYVRTCIAHHARLQIAALCDLRLMRACVVRTLLAF